LTELRHDLKTIEPDCRQTMSLIDKVNGAIPRKPNGGTGKDTSPKRKSDPAKSSADKNKKYLATDPRKKTRFARYCKRCAEKSPKHKETHDTKDCRLWNEDLSPANKRASFMQARLDNAEGGDRKTADMFAQLQLENKKLSKKLSKMNKKGRKSSTKAQIKKILAAADSSDSSDSDSE
jgi:hypothetical protein